MTQTLPRLDGAALLDLSQKSVGAPPCDVCVSLQQPGWESMPGSFDRATLDCVASLRDPGDEDPTLQEYHPNGTHGWSAEAPIAVRYHPYNRCDVWACRSCARVFLRYTEYGGYYHDERVRLVNPALVVVDADAA